jgi:hypothetical protein
MSTLSRLCRPNIKEWESLKRGQGTFTTRVQLVKEQRDYYKTHVKTSNQNVMGLPDGLKYNNINIINLPYAIYFSTFKNTVFMFITCEFDFQNDFCLAIYYHYFIFKTTNKLTNLN